MTVEKQIQIKKMTVEKYIKKCQLKEKFKKNCPRKKISTIFENFLIDF